MTVKIIVVGSSNGEDKEKEKKAGPLILSVLLQESSLTGIPQIARAEGFLRWLKLFLFLACLGGFIWQTNAFLRIFLKFPVQLNVEVQYPPGIMLPALTLCTGYRYNKQRYCKINRNHCEEIEDELFVKEEYKKSDLNPSKADLDLYGYTWKDLEFYNQLQWAELPFFGPKDPIKLRVRDNYGRIAECFVLNHQVFAVNKSLVLFPTEKKKLMTMAFEAAHIYINDDNRKRFGDKTRFLYLAAHSPFVLQNPYFEGISLKLDSYMYGQFYLEETHLLPWPYTTDCTDYFSIWEKKKNTPLSREICIQKCFSTRVEEACGCFPLGVLYPSELEFCGKSQEACIHKVDVESCYTSCKPDCTSFHYYFKLEPRAVEFRISLILRLLSITDVSDDFENVTEVSQVNGISMILSRTSKMVYKYQPKYETVKLFSYIGGYIGVWLGISLTALLDFFGILYRVAFKSR